MSKDVEVLTSTEARVEFGWSRDMMTKLLRSGTLPFTTDPLDKRLKWVKRSDVARLCEASRKRKLQPQSPNSTSIDQAKAASIARTSTADRRATRRRESDRLKPSDQVVLNYLRTLCAVTGTETTSPVGYETIAERCGICPRQAQICCDRLVTAHRLERLGYDAGHPDLTQRGMRYRVPGATHDSHCCQRPHQGVTERVRVMAQGSRRKRVPQSGDHAGGTADGLLSSLSERQPARNTHDLQKHHPRIVGR